MLRRLLLLLVAFARCEVVDYYAAHEVLSDDDRRRAYDATGADEPDAEAEARAAEQGPPEYTELPVKVEARFRHGAFRFSFAGTGVRAMSATRVPITVTMEDLLVGVTRNLTLSRRVRCRACDGTGSARPARRPTCPLCGGTGRAPALGAAGRPPSPFRQSFESLCGACGGFGKLRGPPCASCDGEGIAAETHVVTVVVPPGAPEGHEIVFRGLGDEHAHRDAGDLVVVVEAAPHGRFARSVDGANVWCNASVGLLDALYGFSKKLTGLDGARLDVRHDRVAFSSFTHELPGEGLPVFGNATQRGSLTVYVAVSFPRSLSALQLRVLRHIGLRPDELDFIRALQLLMAYQYATTGVAGGGMGSATSARFQQEKQEGKEKRVHRPDDAAAAPEKRPRLAEDASTGGRLMRTFCGVAETIGKKRTMEDRSSVIQLADGRVFVGVYDGHAGPCAAEHAAATLHTRLDVAPPAGGSSNAAMWEAAYEQCEREILRRSTPGLISATPEVTDRSLKPGWDDFAIFATDGLWDVVSDADAVGIVYDTIGEALASGSVTQELCTEAASKCIQAARKRCTMDNVLVLVLCFQWRPKSGAAA
ncbi:hypothetical protein JL722_12401 [Aureococcus anophagefferens]|nr:hypothetical protein JL722_12401 [Aureococcus anophagefferens]